MKRIIVMIMVVAAVFSLCAVEGPSETSSSNAGSALFKDIGIRVGNGTFLWNDHMDMGLHFLGGMTLGLTKRLEMAVEAITPIVPDPLSDIVAGFELSYALIGDRISLGNTAGTGVNMLVSLGLFCSTHNGYGAFMPTYLTLRVNSLTIGTPYSGKREHLLPIGVAWNFMEGEFSFFCSIIMYDHYIKSR